MGKCGKECRGNCKKGCRSSAPNCYKGFEVECLNIKPGDSYDSIIKKLADYICEQGFQEKGIDHITFLESTGTPSNQAGQPGETDTYVVWGDLGETISLGTFVITNGSSGGGSSTILYNKTAYVDVDNGDDLTAIVGRLDRPYKDLQAALDDSDIVHIMPGEFDTDYDIESDKYVYADLGVKFTSKGFSVGTDGVFTLRGHTVFSGDSYAIDASGNSVVDMEFDSITTTGEMYSVMATSDVRLKMKRGYCEGGSSQKTGVCSESATLSIDIEEDLVIWYCHHIYEGVDSSFRGSFIINCPHTYLTGDGTINANKCAYFIENMGYSTIDINGHTKYTGDVTISNIFLIDSPAGPFSKLNIIGDIRGTSAIGLSVAGIAEIEIYKEGDIVVSEIPISTTAGVREGANIIKVKDGYIQGNSILIKDGTDLYLDRVSCYTTGSSTSNILYDSLGSQGVNIYCYSTYFEIVNLAGTMISKSGGTVLANIFTVNTMSNKAMEAGLSDSWSSLVIKDDFKTPKY